MDGRLEVDAAHKICLGLKITSQSPCAAETVSRSVGTAFGLMKLPGNKNPSKAARLPGCFSSTRETTICQLMCERVPQKIITERATSGSARLTPLWAGLIKTHSGKQICKHSSENTIKDGVKEPGWRPQQAPRCSLLCHVTWPSGTGSSGKVTANDRRNQIQLSHSGQY